MLKVLEVPRRLSLLVDLPNEILVEILDNLERRDLNKLVRVNKRYHGLAQYILEHRKKIRLCGDHSRVLVLSLPSKYNSISLTTTVSRSAVVSSTLFSEAPTTEINPTGRTRKNVVQITPFKNHIPSLVAKDRKVSLIEAPTANNLRVRLYTLAVKADLCLLIVDPEEIDAYAEDIKEMIFGCCFMMSARNIIVAIDLSNVTAKESSGLCNAFNQAKLKISKLLNKTVGTCYTIIPINVRTGTNITANITPKYEWFSGASLKKLILDDQLRTNFDSSSYKKLCEAPLRLQLTNADKIAGIGTVIEGRVISGTLTPNSTIGIHPDGIRTLAKSIESYCTPLETAYPGDIIGINIKNVSLFDLYPKCSYLIKPTETPMVNCTIAFRAQIVVMKSDRLVQHQTYNIFYGSSRIPCILWWIFPELDEDGEISAKTTTTRKFKVEKPKKKEYRHNKQGYKMKLMEYKQQVKEMKLKFQAKSSERPPRKHSRKVTAILLPLIHYDIEPYKPSEFEKNYSGKLMIIEKRTIIGVGRVDRVICNSAKTFQISYIWRRDHSKQYDEVVSKAASLFTLPKEQTLHELFLDHVINNEHAKNTIKKSK